MIPEELRLERRWVVWKYQTTDKGRKTKVPYKAMNTDQKAASVRPEDWTVHAIAKNAASRADGIGFVFTGSAYSGIDLDWKPYPGDGVPPEALAIIEAAGSYAEVTPSGKGAHVILRGKLPEGCRNKVRLSEHVELEVYSEGRYFTFTGRNYKGYDTVADGQAYLNQLAATLLKAPEKTREAARTAQPVSASDHELLEVARGMKDGGKFNRLWNGDTADYVGDHSRADLALCLRLAWLTGGDANRMDTLFRSSALMREKWDRRARTGETYGQGTIREALEKWDGSTYQPRQTATRTRAAAPALTREAWAATIDDAIFERAESTLLGASGHHRTITSFFDLQVFLLTQAQNPANVILRGAGVLVRFGGMRQLVKDLGGRIQDRRKQLEYLSSVGLIGGLTRLEGEDSELCITFPQDILELPAYQERLRLELPVSEKARAVRKQVYSPPLLETPPLCRTEKGGEYTPTRLQTLRRVARTALALQRQADTLPALVRRTRYGLETVQSHLSDLVSIGFVERQGEVYTLLGDYRAEVRRELDFHDAYVERCKRDLEASAQHWGNVAADPTQPMWKRTSARRRRDLAILRFERIDAGERVSEVLRRAA